MYGPAGEIAAALGGEVIAYPGQGGWPIYVEPAPGPLRENRDCGRGWFRDHRADFDRLLVEYGAVILRGFPLHDADDFSSFIQHLPAMPHGYAAGAAKRRQLADRVYDTTSTRAPNYTTMLHQEMAYMPVFPYQIAFFCHIPPSVGGETPIADIRRLRGLLPRELVEKVEAVGVRYMRSFRAPGQTIDAPEEYQYQLQAFYRTWPDALNTSDRGEAEHILRRTGLQFEWLPGGGLSTYFHSSGFTDHPITGERAWFNQLTLQHANHKAAGLSPELFARAFPDGQPKAYDALYGDGEPVDEALMLELYRIQESILVAPHWQAGDLMLLDNIYVGHGGNPYRGERDIQVSMFR